MLCKDVAGVRDFILNGQKVIPLIQKIFNQRGIQNLKIESIPREALWQVQFSLGEPLEVVVQQSNELPWVLDIEMNQEPLVYYDWVEQLISRVEKKLKIYSHEIEGQNLTIIIQVDVRWIHELVEG